MGTALTDTPPVRFCANPNHLRRSFCASRNVHSRRAHSLGRNASGTSKHPLWVPECDVVVDPAGDADVLGLGKPIKGARTTRRSTQVFHWVLTVTSQGACAEIRPTAVHNHHLSRCEHLTSPSSPSSLAWFPCMQPCPLAHPCAQVRSMRLT